MTTHLFRRVRLTLFLITLAACTSATPQAASISAVGQIYESPLHNFALPITNLGPGTVAQYRSDPESGTVSFYNDFGTLRRLDYNRLPYPLPADATSRLEFYRATLNQGLAGIGARLLTSESVTIDGAEMLFAFIFIPQGSTSIDARTNKHDDTTRELLIFAHGDFIYMAMSQSPGQFFSRPEKDESKWPEHTARAKVILKDFYHTIVFH